MSQSIPWTVATPFEEHRAFATAAEAEAYAQRLCTAVYGDQGETERQLPFRATLEGEVWRVVGSRPYNWPIASFPLTGPLTITFDRATGRTLDMHFTGAPAGWDAGVLHQAPPSKQ